MFRKWFYFLYGNTYRHLTIVDGVNYECEGLVYYANVVDGGEKNDRDSVRDDFEGA